MRYVLLVAALSAGIATGAAAGDDRGEIGYAPGSLGYDAIVAGDFAAAEHQIETAAIAANDPARMLNLGYIHMRTGRTLSAQRLFEAVRDSRQHFMVELTNGQGLDSREVARMALARLSTSVNVATR